MNGHYPLQKLDRRNMIDCLKYLKGNQAQVLSLLI